MFSHPPPGTPIDASVSSNDFFEDVKHLVSDVKTLKERNETLQNRVDQLESDRETLNQKHGVQQTQFDLQNEKFTLSQSDMERLKKEIEEARMSITQQKQEIERSAQKIVLQNQLISQLKTQLQQQNEMISGLTTRTEREKKTNEEERTSTKQQPKTQINSAQSTNVIEAKVVCAGGRDTGQSYILRYYTYTFAYFYETSIEVDGKKVNLTLWDTAGTEEYDQLRPFSYESADVFMLFFSVISEESFKRIETFWIPDISEYLNDCPVVLVGTHSDARASPPDGVTLVSKEQAEQLVEKLKLFGYVECSATTKEGLPEAFEAAARAALRKALSGDASTCGTCSKGGCGCEIM
ncbi:putative Transforming protein RhoA [Blattamonas nauphoetae]|uniref:Transforming protein RhoA n=1 Tax=Blattamonas nauphoetae TaxID=2049346 RepID=A0ABQ9Y6Q9_9EUKA|nr:putative Transforming protein RhoA [Blattamonas nauphoetae]